MARETRKGARKIIITSLASRLISSLVPSRISLTRGKIRLVTLGTEIGARTAHGMWNCAEIIMIAK